MTEIGADAASAGSAQREIFFFLEQKKMRREGERRDGRRMEGEGMIIIADGEFEG